MMRTPYSAMDQVNVNVHRMPRLSGVLAISDTLMGIIYTANSGGTHTVVAAGKICHFRHSVDAVWQ